MKVLKILFLLLFSMSFSQILKTVKIVDEDDKPLSKVRIILLNEILYTNNDGLVMIPEQAGNFEISKTGYQSQRLGNWTPIVKMIPSYKNIEEVKIIGVDIKDLFDRVSQNYTKLYFSKPSTYNILYKQKNTEDDGNISFLLIAEANLWSSTNYYSFKFQNDYNKFIQLQLNNIKYFKSAKSENEILNAASLDQSKDFVGNIFFNYELRRLVSFLNAKDAKYSGRLLNESGNNQLIYFKINSPSIGVDVYGNINYNKADKIITSYEMNYDQGRMHYIKAKSNTGIEYEFRPGNGTIFFEFYKKDNSYVPSLSAIKGDSYVIYNGKEMKKTFDREIVFQKIDESATEEPTSRIDFNRKLWENIPDNEKKDSKIILSSDEKKFVEEKN